MNARSSIAAALAAILTLLLAVPAFAQDDADDDDANAQIQETSRQLHRYFRREKGGAIGFMTVGGASVVAGGILLLQDSDTVKGVGYPLLGFGLIGATLGTIVYLRTDDQVAELDKLLADDPATFKAREKERMENVMLGFDIVESVEALLILGGLSMAIIGKVDENDTLRGYGLGMAGEAAAFFVMDVIAARRAQPYIQAIEKLEVDDKGQPTAGGVGGAMAGVVLNF